MKRVELLYFVGCPHIDAAREQLRRAFTRLQRDPKWTEIDVNALDAPAHVRGFGSPSILVDGVDVVGGGPAAAPACRVYVGTDLPGAPPLELLVARLS